jgi:hypothetical protein
MHYHKFSLAAVALQPPGRQWQHRMIRSLAAKAILPGGRRENTGNYAILGAFEAGEATKTPHPACVFSRNSLEIGTGNFK